MKRKLKNEEKIFETSNKPRFYEYKTTHRIRAELHIFELGYNVMRGTEYFVPF
jgi:hypothetical protein